MFIRLINISEAKHTLISVFVKLNRIGTVQNFEKRAVLFPLKLRASSCTGADY